MVIGSSLKIFDETASFWRNFDFFAFLGFLGVRALVLFSGTPIRLKIPENRIWGPVEDVSGKFSGDLKVAHGDSATDDPKKSGFWAVGPDLLSKIPVRACAGSGAYAQELEDLAVFSRNPKKSGLGARRGHFSQIFRRPKSCAW